MSRSAARQQQQQRQSQDPDSEYDPTDDDESVSHHQLAPSFPFPARRVQSGWLMVVEVVVVKGRRTWRGGADDGPCVRPTVQETACVDPLLI